jgi:hypothetical protein
MECLVNNPNGEAYLIVTTEAQLAKFEPQLLIDLKAIGGGDSAPDTPPVPVPDVPSPTPPSVIPTPFLRRIEAFAREEIAKLEADIQKIKDWVQSLGGSA